MQPTLYSADWVLPVSSPPVRAGAVLVDEDGVIRYVGAASGIEVGEATARIELGEALLLPGLINTHTHPELTGMRGLLEDLPFHSWIPTLRAAKDGAQLSAADYAAAARWACLEAMAAGVTTIGATEDSGAALDALRDAGLRGVVYREVFGPAPHQAVAALSKLRVKVDDMMRRQTDLVRVGISPHAPYTVSDELFRQVAEWAVADGIPVAVHAAEASVEHELVAHGTGVFADGLQARGIATPKRASSTIRLLEQTGVMAARPLLIHCILLQDDDLRIIADHGAAVAHCPVANARLGHGIAPVMELLDAGVRVGLGTDSVASNNRVDMMEEARTAHLLQRARLCSPTVLPADRLLRLMTLDGARALGLDGRVGSLEPGKDADLCAVRITAPHTVPVIDPLTTLLHSARGSDVILTAVRGRPLFRDGRQLTLDGGPIRPVMDRMAARLAAARDSA
jgi:cytosine/adenosine deaminase-related metal-dependent hydrolase